MWIELARLEQNCISDADFSHVVKNCGLLDQFGSIFGESELAGDDAGVLADAQHVVAGFLIAVFRRSRQHMNHILSRLRQFHRA